MKKRCTHILFKPISKKSGIARLKNNAAVLLLLLLFSVFTIPAWAQNAIKVTGVVKDNKGATLPGVSVKVKGSTLGTLTDIDGKYSLNVPNTSAILVFSYVSFNTKEVTVGSNKAIDVTLTDASTDLSEIVVTGYGQSVTKRDLTGSIATVSAKQIEERQPVNLADALQGQIAGAQVVTDGGDPFSQGTIQIRGASSLNSTGNGPLYVIDGVINNDANFLNPADIASIEVLKDASSVAIYGSRGANGVIIITTKRGKEGKPNVRVDYYHLFGKLAHKLHTVSANDLRYYRSQRGDGNATLIDSTNHYLNADNDYQDLLFRTGNKDNLSVSVSGGQKGLTYYTGVNYYSDKSIAINSYAQNVRVTSNVDYQGSEKLKISNNLSYSYITGNSIDVGSSAKQVFERNPWTSLYKPDGTYNGYIESKRNPVAQAVYGQNVPTNISVQDNIMVNYQLLKELRFTTSFNSRLDNKNTAKFTPDIITNGSAGPNSGSNELDKILTYEFQAFLNYNKTFVKDHHVTGLLAFTRDRTREDDYQFAGTNYLSELVHTTNVATLNLANGATAYDATYYGSESVFGRLGYDYKGRYFINGTLRRDGSSRFGPDNKWGNFYAGAIAWRFSDEPFMAWAKNWLDDGKLRYTIGTAGNDRVGNFTYSSFIDFGGGSYNGSNIAYPDTQIGNPTIKWESTKTQNFGLDLTLLKGRLTITPEYYIKATYGLLYPKKTPEESGVVQGSINLGNIESRGFELAISGTPISKKDLSWNVNANITIQNAAVVKSLADHQPYIVSTSFQIKEGGHVGDFYLLKNLGVYQYDVSNAYAADGSRLTPVGVVVDKATNTSTATGYTLNGQPYTGPIHQISRNGYVLKGGNTMWQDTNNDGVINDDDRIITGNAIPKFFFGINNYVKYKGFSLNFLFNGSFGNKVYNSVANGQNAFSSTYSPPTYAAIYNSWHNQGDVVTYPNFRTINKDQYGDISNGINSLYMEDGSFIRLSSAKLTYDLGARLASKIKSRSIQLYIYGNNLATWTNYDWYDPEFTSSNVLSQGIDGGKYPRRREVGIGAVVNF